jgi:hypothetical protein
MKRKEPQIIKLAFSGGEREREKKELDVSLSYFKVNSGTGKLFLLLSSSSPSLTLLNYPIASHGGT